MATRHSDAAGGMILDFFRRAQARRRAIATLHRRVNEGARAPGLFRALDVPDTVEGRFEALCLHAILVLRRLKALPPPASDVAQDLVDTLFSQFDASLRELGVGDLGVAKRIKRLASSFYGRASGYGAALDAGDEAGLAASLARNVLGEDDPGRAAGLARYVVQSARDLDRHDLAALLGDGPRFPSPESFGA